MYIFARVRKKSGPFHSKYIQENILANLLIKQTAEIIDYLQVRNAPADSTKDASAMIAETILAFFTIIASNS